MSFLILVHSGVGFYMQLDKAFSLFTSFYTPLNKQLLETDNLEVCLLKETLFSTLL